MEGSSTIKLDPNALFIYSLLYSATVNIIWKFKRKNLLPMYCIKFYQILQTLEIWIQCMVHILDGKSEIGAYVRVISVILSV